jgi:hypothetical protein
MTLCLDISKSGRVNKANRNWIWRGRNSGTIDLLHLRFGDAASLCQRSFSPLWVFLTRFILGCRVEIMPDSPFFSGETNSVWQPVAVVEEPDYFISSYCLFEFHRDRSHLDTRGSPDMTFPLALQHGFISDLNRVMFVSELDM